MPYLFNALCLFGQFAVSRHLSDVHNCVFCRSAKNYVYSFSRKT